MGNRLIKNFLFQLPLLMGGMNEYQEEYFRHKETKPKEPTHRDSNYRAWQKEYRKKIRAKRRKARR